MRSGSTVIDVVEVDAETWDVREPGSDRPLSSWFSRTQAVRAATIMLREGRGGEIRVTSSGGETERVEVEVGRRPWWQLARSPRGAFVLGGLLLISAVGQLVLSILDHTFRVYPVIMTIFALAVVASGVAQLRLSRR